MPSGAPSSPRDAVGHDPEESGPRRREPSLEIEIALRASGELAAELPTLRRFAGYEILGRMAVGGMAEVFLARERAEAGGARHVVLKVIRAQLANDPGFAEMFLNEGKVTLGLRHPNVCHTYRFGVEGGHPYLAMELVSGVTVRELLARARSRKSPLPAPIAAKIASQVAEALHSAHVARDERGRALEVVHQDVSPHNVMLAYDGTVKLLDFGVASSSIEQKVDASETSHTTIRGKAAYLSPEQCVGARVDARSDVFALGIVLHEMLTGERIFKRAQSLDSMRAIVSEPLPAWPSTIPEPLQQILDRALKREPEERYQTAAAMQDDLERYLAESRTVVTSARIAEVMARLLGDDFAKPPRIDTGREVVAWMRAELDPTAAPFPLVARRESEPPEPAPEGAGRRTRDLVLGALGAAIAIALGIGALVATRALEVAPRPRDREPAPPHEVAPTEITAPPGEAAPTADVRVDRADRDTAAGADRAAPEAPPGETEAPPGETGAEREGAATSARDPAAPSGEARARRAAERARRRTVREVAPGGFVDDPGF